jgi:hypothetical protein
MLAVTIMGEASSRRDFISCFSVELDQLNSFIRLAGQNMRIPQASNLPKQGCFGFDKSSERVRLLRPEHALNDKKSNNANSAR